MYTPPFNRVDDEAEIRRMVAACRTAWLITSSETGLPLATFLPIIWRDSTVIAHMAKANPHWRHIGADAPALLIATGPQAYISPSWYAAKAEHGKVVPTWNYSAVQLSGTAQVHVDPDWLRKAVTDLTEVHERDREPPWHVTDAPEPFIAGQLGGIVGIEIAVTDVTAKAKLSQNRSAADQRGVVEGLQADAHRDGQAVAEAMSDALGQALRSGGR
ncbi:MAG TPA: FMN-binding negative transcriptional regulator [Pseudonocardia sp.]